MDDHTDYMWTADEETYRQAFLEMLDYYLDLADATGSEPADYQSRFNTDGTLWVKVYEEDRSPARFQRLISRIKSGHITVPLVPLALVFGGAPTEAVIRSMYYAGYLQRTYGLDFPLGVAQENQTLPYGLGALFAGAGARYSFRGICGCHSQVGDAWDREHDIYRWTGPDGSSLLMKWNSMLTHDNQSMGGYAEARYPTAVVDYVDSDESFKARYPYDVIGAFGYGWDDLKSLTDIMVQAAKQTTTTSRRVIVSNERDFFEDFDRTYGSDLPELAVTFGNEWDLYVASMAEVTAGVRRSTEKLRAAEAMAALATLEDPDFMTSRRADRDRAMLDLGLYFEHNWVGGGNVGTDARAAWQRRIAAEIAAYVDDLYDDGIAALGAAIHHEGDARRYFVFNPLGWSRDDYADLPGTFAQPVHVIDLATGDEVPSQTVTVSGTASLRVLVPGVPAAGYKVLEVRDGAGASFSNAAIVDGQVLENDAYRLTVGGNGAIMSLVDKLRGNREMVRTISGRTANDLGGTSGSVVAENVGPVTVTLKATGTDPLQHVTRVTFVRDSSRIEIQNEIQQGFSSTYTWAFGFDLDGPDVWHEEVGAVIHARLSTGGGHYASRNARYDWMTLNHFVDMTSSTAGAGVTLSSADLTFFKLGSSSVTTLDTTTPQVSVLAGGQVDGTYLGIPNQGGDTWFLQRFALRTHGTYHAPSAMAFALEHQNPLVAGPVLPGGDLPGTSLSMIDVSSSDLLLWAFKPAEEGGGALVARLWNLANEARSFTLKLGVPIDRARPASLIETPTGTAAVSSGKVTGEAAPNQLVTFLLYPEDQGASTPVGDTPGPDHPPGCGGSTPAPAPAARDAHTTREGSGGESCTTLAGAPSDSRQARPWWGVLGAGLIGWPIVRWLRR